MKPGSTITLVLLTLLIAVKSLGFSVLSSDLHQYRDTESRISKSLPVGDTFLAEEQEFLAESNLEEEGDGSSPFKFGISLSAELRALSRHSYIPGYSAHSHADSRLFLRLCVLRL